jgi:hypothetical protein
MDVLNQHIIGKVLSKESIFFPPKALKHEFIHTFLNWLKKPYMALHAFLGG